MDGKLTLQQVETLDDLLRRFAMHNVPDGGPHSEILTTQATIGAERSRLRDEQLAWSEDAQREMRRQRFEDKRAALLATAERHGDPVPSGSVLFMAVVMLDHAEAEEEHRMRGFSILREVAMTAGPNPIPVSELLNASSTYDILASEGHE